MDRFREHFRGFETAYVLIGGAACDAWMSRSGLPFRKTKDLDIVLVIEAIEPAFVARFKEFVAAGHYQVRQRQEAGRREFFRFLKPAEDGYPSMLELFSRAPADLDLGPDQQVAPVAVEASVASLSAILMDEGYYELVLAKRYDSDGIPMVGADGLIPLKARAWLDLSRRKADGESIDENDIKKHRNDVFRLALTLTGELGPEMASGIRADLQAFLAAFPITSSEWPGILHALQGTVRNPPSPGDLLEAIQSRFRLV
jgi:hypothetical protein